MPTIRIFNKEQGIQADANGHPVILQRQGVTEVEVADWVEIKKQLKSMVDKGFIGPESEIDEKHAISSFREALHAQFALLGVPAVKIALESGEFSSGAKKLEAAEWLLRQEHEYKSEALAIAREANSIANEAKLIAAASVEAATKQATWAKWAAIIAVIAAIISAKNSIIELLSLAL